MGGRALMTKTSLPWKFLTTFLTDLGQKSLFLLKLFQVGRRGKLNLFQLTLEQLVNICTSCIGIILFTGFFVGAILIVQFHLILVKYDALVLTGGLSTSAILREIGPLLISFLIAGKIGSYTTAELATCKITGQLDAMKCLGVDPYEFLVLPRYIAIVLGTSLLLFFALVIGITGCLFISEFLYGINFLRYLESIPRFVNHWTFFGSFFKSIVYGLIIATLCTYYGVNAEKGARGVGVAVTKTSTYTAFMIVIANSATSYLIEYFQHLFMRISP